MYILVYNPLASNNKGAKLIEQAVKELHIEKPAAQLSVLDFDDNDNLTTILKGYPENYKVILIGGDGTLNKFINKYRNADIKQQILFYSKGTGNDFQRNFPQIEKTKSHKLLDITKHINKIHLDTQHHNKNIRITAINALGIGVDGLIIKMYHDAKIHNKFSYTLKTIQAFFKYRPADIELILDGKKIEFKKCWLVAINNGKYFGGGMKIAPRAVINDDLLDICVIHNMNKFVLLWHFPSVFRGKHLKVKSVFYAQAKQIKYSSKQQNYIEYDGELLDFKSNNFIAKVE